VLTTNERQYYNVVSDPFMVRIDQRTTHKWRLAVKDNIDVGGYRTGGGNKYLSETMKPAFYDAECVRRAKMYNGDVVGKTTMVELALGGHGINAWAGTPENPCDSKMCPGGSSSGSSVAVATGDADIGIGTDTGGSVRIPAACCGLFGLKTTYDTISTKGVMPLARSMDTIGIIAKNINSVAAWLDMMGIDTEAAMGDVMSVGVLTNVASVNISNAVNNTLKKTKFALKEISAGSIKWKSIASVGNIVLEFEAASEYGWMAAESKILSTSVASRIKRGVAMDRDLVVEARRRIDDIRIMFRDIFAKYDVLICPTLTSRPPYLNNGLHWSFNALTIQANVAGLPVIVVPLVDEKINNWPVSVQIIGSWGEESRLLQIATALESMSIIRVTTGEN